MRSLAASFVRLSPACAASTTLNMLVTETDVRHGDDPVQHVVGRVSLECAINVGMTFGEGMPDRVILQSLH